MSQYHVYILFTLLKKTSEFTFPSSSPWFGPFYVSNPLMAGTSLDGRIILLVAGSLLFTKASKLDSALGSCSLDLFTDVPDAPGCPGCRGAAWKGIRSPPPPSLRRMALADPGEGKPAVPPRSQLAPSCCLSCPLTSFPSGIPHQFLTALGVGLAPWYQAQLWTPCCWWSDWGLSAGVVGSLQQWVWHSELMCLTKAPDMISAHPQGENCARRNR